MRIERSTLIRVLIGLAVVALLIVVLCTLPSTTFSGKPRSGPVARITTFGEHFTPESDWVESISVTEEEDENLIFIQERTVVTGKKWWNPFQSGNSSRMGLKHPCPPADEFRVTISDEHQTVTYEAGNYRWTYDSLDPKGTIAYEEHITPDAKQ